ncbi:hypothetical protein ACSHWB_45060 [Lentzea sp. HUAS TT2]|uniref:hypothetical protein n=1 Tax=Lentzea sp. HUAS TT2 TaxID=3447454 RepID=UPI003F6E6FAA
MIIGVRDRPDRGGTPVITFEACFALLGSTPSAGSSAAATRRRLVVLTESADREVLDRT